MLEYTLKNEVLNKRYYPKFKITFTSTQQGFIVPFSVQLILSSPIKNLEEKTSFAIGPINQPAHILMSLGSKLHFSAPSPASWSHMKREAYSLGIKEPNHLKAQELVYNTAFENGLEVRADNGAQM